MKYGDDAKTVTARAHHQRTGTRKSKHRLYRKGAKTNLR
jgi:hypothetical protein